MFNNDFEGGMHKITVPVYLSYNINKLQPSAGLNYNYLIISSMEHNNTNVSLHNFGINLGVAYAISDRFSINLEYLHNLTKNYDLGVVGFNGNDDQSIRLKNSQLIFSIAFNLRKKATTKNLEGVDN